MRRAAAAGLALACGAGGGGALTPEAPAPAPLGVIPSAGEARYVTHSHLFVQQEVGGRVQKSELHLTYFLTAALSPHGDRLIARLVLDSVPRYEGDAATALDFQKAHGATFTGTLSPEGDLAGFTGGDSTVRFLRELTDELRQFFPRLPAGGARPGAQWVDTTEQQSNPSGVPLLVRSVTEHEVGNVETHAGERALPIRSRTTYTFEGTGTQGGTEFRVEGAGRRATVEFLSLQGRYLGLTTADSSGFRITLGAVNLEIPGRQARADTVAIVR